MSPGHTPRGTSRYSPAREGAPLGSEVPVAPGHPAEPQRIPSPCPSSAAPYTPEELDGLRARQGERTKPTERSK